MIRGLITSDLYKVSRILKKMGLKLDANNITIKDKEGNKLTQEQVGIFVIIELITKAVENFYLAENEVNDFLGSLVGKTSEEFANLEIEETFKVIEELKNIPGIANFFKRASQLTK